MTKETGPLTVREWLALVRAVPPADVRARAALSRLMRYHQVDEQGIEAAAHVLVDAPGARTKQGRRRMQSPDVFGMDAAVAVPAVPAVDLVVDTEGDAAPAADDARFALPDTTDDNALNFDAIASTEPGPRWELVGPMVDLSRASTLTGLDHNAIRLTTEGRDPEGTIVHPSSFCPDPEQFLSVLAVLARTTPHVRLYRVNREASGPASVLVRVFPDPGPETLDVLETFHPRAAAQLRDASRAVADALAYLTAQAELDP